jgi:hypothetical protein
VENPEMLAMASAKIDAVKALDERISAHDGTMAELLKKGTEAAVATPLADLVKLFGPITAEDGAVTYGGRKAWVTDVLGTLSTAPTFGDFVANLDTLVTATREVGLELSTLWIKSNHEDLTSRDALVAQRAELANVAESFIVVLRDMGVDGADKLEVPDAPKGKGKGSTSSGGATKGGKVVRFYRLDGDVRKYPSDGQQKASSVAHYQFDAGIEAMEAAMKAAGWNGQYTTPWEGSITVTNKSGEKTTTKTIGWEVNEPTADKEADKEDGDK